MVQFEVNVHYFIEVTDCYDGYHIPNDLLNESCCEYLFEVKEELNEKHNVDMIIDIVLDKEHAAIISFSDKDYGRLVLKKGIDFFNEYEDFLYMEITPHGEFQQPCFIDLSRI